MSGEQWSQKSWRSSSWWGRGCAVLCVCGSSCWGDLTFQGGLSSLMTQHCPWCFLLASRLLPSQLPAWLPGSSGWATSSSLAPPHVHRRAVLGVVFNLAPARAAFLLPWGANIAACHLMFQILTCLVCVLEVLWGDDGQHWAFLESLRHS